MLQMGGEVSSSSPPIAEAMQRNGIEKPASSMVPSADDGSIVRVDSGIQVADGAPSTTLDSPTLRLLGASPGDDADGNGRPRRLGTDWLWTGWSTTQS
jgi:hypothetical protein